MPARTLIVSTALTLTLAAAAFAGPPWISIELPANPHHATTRDATMLVRTYHHSSALNAELTGTAEGIVDGRRVSLPLELRRTNQPGVYAVTTPLPKGGMWIIAVTVNESEHSSATALVTVDPRGRIVDIDVPSTKSRDGWTVPRRVQKSDIEAALRSAQIAYGDRGEPQHRGLAFALPLVLFGGVAVAGLSKLRR